MTVQFSGTTSRSQKKIFPPNRGNSHMVFCAQDVGERVALPQSGPDPSELTARISGFVFFGCHVRDVVEGYIVLIVIII